MNPSSPPPDWPSLAESHPLLAELPGTLRAAAACREVAAGETLFRRGTRPRAMLYVLDGEVRLVRHTAGGREVVVQRVRRGFVAEASLNSPRYHCDVTTAEAGRLIAFPMPLFRQTLDDHPGFRQSWTEMLAGEVRRLRARIERLQLHRAVDRVIHYLESEGVDGSVTLSQPVKAWAGELGLSHEALYRALASLERQGQIERRERVLRVRSARRLASPTKSPQGAGSGK